jgi:hypothetical protein
MERDATDEQGSRRPNFNEPFGPLPVGGAPGFSLLWHSFCYQELVAERLNIRSSLRQ